MLEDVFGKPCEEAWPDVYPIIGPLMKGILETGKAVMPTDQFVPYKLGQRFQVEKYFTYCFSPIRLRTGNKVGGIFTVVHDTTSKVLGTSPAI
jgi:hypothetical protein